MLDENTKKQVLAAYQATKEPKAMPKKGVLVLEEGESPEDAWKRLGTTPAKNNTAPETEVQRPRTFEQVMRKQAEK